MALEIQSIPFRAQVTSVAETDPTYETFAMHAMELAAKSGKMSAAEVSPIGANGKPRMLALSAFIAHTDVANRNGSGFIRSDIEEVVAAGMFQAPYMGMIDYNHDFRAYGAWYEASLMYDPKAKQYGIYAKGAMFAWAYPELADRMLAMQQRNGFIDVSIACIPKAWEEGQTADGSAVTWLRNPIFFTTSLLDIPPADPHAQGVGSEDPAMTEEARQNALIARASLEEQSMNPDEQKPDNAETENAGADPKPDEKPVNDQALSAAEAEIETLKVALAAAETALTALQAENVELANFRMRMETKHAEDLAAAQAAEATAKAEAIKAARLADVPEAVKEDMLTPEKASLLESWITMSDEQWALTKSLFEKAAAAGRKSRVNASEDEGKLGTNAEENSTGRRIDAWRNRAVK
jgi:hypothetical protein